LSWPGYKAVPKIRERNSSDSRKRAEFLFLFLLLPRLRNSHSPDFGTHSVPIPKLSNKEIYFNGHPARIRLGSLTLSETQGYSILTKSPIANAHPITDYIIRDKSGSNALTAGFSPEHSVNNNDNVRPTISTSSVLTDQTLNDNLIAFIYVHENGHGSGLDDVNSVGNVMHYSLKESVIQKIDVDSFIFKNIKTVETGTTIIKGNQDQWDDFRR